jgi:hypothetical protein
MQEREMEAEIYHVLVVDLDYQVKPLLSNNKK